MQENFSQFSDNAVLSPLTTNEKVLPTECLASLAADDEQLTFTNKDTTITAASDCTVTSSPQSYPEDFGDVLSELESPDLENKISLSHSVKEVNERTADTIIISSEDAGNNEERPFKITTPGFLFVLLYKL